jgi:hypothetical protein
VKYANAQQAIEFTTGTTFTNRREQTDSWSKGVEASISTEFKFFGAEAETSVTGTYAKASSTTVSDVMEKSSEIKQTTTFDEGGQVWQFVYTVQDACGSADIKTMDLVITKGQFEPPCCLPGFALTNEQHGPCASGSPCGCAVSTCTAPPPSSTSPSPPSEAKNTASTTAGGAPPPSPPASPPATAITAEGPAKVGSAELVGIIAGVVAAIAGLVAAIYKYRGDQLRHKEHMATIELANKMSDHRKSPE